MLDATANMTRMRATVADSPCDETMGLSTTAMPGRQVTAACGHSTSLFVAAAVTSCTRAAGEDALIIH
jgi:hypothetical protein